MSYSGDFYLVLSAASHGYKKLNARLAVRKPRLQRGEVAIELNVSVPDTLFDRPILKASVEVPEAAAAQSVITADVMQNIGETLSRQLGIRVEVTADSNTGSDHES